MHIIGTENKKKKKKKKKHRKRVKFWAFEYIGLQQI